MTATINQIMTDPREYAFTCYHRGFPLAEMHTALKSYPGASGEWLKDFNTAWEALD
jgi:hypothetical protein